MFNQIINKTFPSGYKGTCEKAIYTMSVSLPDQAGARLVANQIIDAHLEAFANEGVELLSLKVWEDRSPTWSTDYKFETVAASPGAIEDTAPEGSISVLPVLAWVLIISAIVIILALLIDWALVSVAVIAKEAPFAFSTVAIIGGIVILGLLGPSILANFGVESKTMGRKKNA